MDRMLASSPLYNLFVAPMAVCGAFVVILGQVQRGESFESPDGRTHSQLGSDKTVLCLLVSALGL